MREETFRYVLIGGGLAAANAVEGIRDIDREGPILMICAEPRLPYNRPPLTKGLLLGKKRPEDIFCKPEEFYSKNQVRVLSGQIATSLNPSLRSVTLDNGAVIHFERLLLATGCRARKLDLPGAHLDGIRTVRTLDDSLALLQAMKEVHRAVVVGGSYIGAETASSLAQNGIQTTVLFPEARLLERLLDAEFGQHLHALFEKHGVVIRTGRKPVAFKGNTRVESVVTDRAEELPAELFVLGVGAVLNDELARQAGLAMGDQGGVRLDERLQTSEEGIFAAGDIADYPDPTFERRFRLEHWDTAFRQGRTAGRNMAGAGESFAALPHYFSTLFDLGFSVWGDFSRWDKTLRKGELGKTGSRIFYLEKGRLCGILAFDPVDKDQEHAIEHLVGQRPEETVIRRLT